MISVLRKDVLRAAGQDSDLCKALAGQVIAVTGGTGFLGSWIAETAAALNDEYKIDIVLHLFARHTGQWANKWPHLAGRKDIVLHNQDVRSSFEFPASTNFVVHAAGIPDNRVHASDPLRVFETTVYGMHNSLEATTKLPGLKRFVNISSGLIATIAGEPVTKAGKAYFVYIDAKRAAESLSAIYRSQYRLPISTLRPFTFIGPYQELDRPWALNNFIRDALSGNEIRLHGDGNIRRSYLYGSDAAWWTLCALGRGGDGKAYNLGSTEAVSHQALAESIAHKVTPTPHIILRTIPASQRHGHDFLPDLPLAIQELQAKQTCNLEEALDKTINWYRASAT